MINEKRYEPIKKIFNERGLEFSEREICLYVDMFEIIAQLTHEKLTNEEMFEAYDILGDIIAGKAMRYAIYVSKEDRIHVQMRFLEELPQTAGKLTEEEKEAFAFCVYYSTCIGVYDEKTDTASSGLVYFTSVEKIVQLWRADKEMRPEFFGSGRENDSEKEGEFGYAIGNPIQATSVGAGYQYLSRLRYKGKKVEVERLGQMRGINDNIIDKYRVKVNKGGLFAKTEEYIIYIDPYSPFNSTQAPEGFSLA